MSDYGIGKYLDISTLHIKESTLDNSIYYTLANYDTGALFWVPDEYDDDTPADLKIVFDYAKLHACSLIRFDADGFEFPELPIYDWE